jgi:starch phosphorylase
MSTETPTATRFPKPEPLSMAADAIAEDARRYYGHLLAGDAERGEPLDAYRALALSLRDRLVERWRATTAAVEAADARQAYYLSLEFLMGRTLNNVLLNLGFAESADPALQKLGVALETLIDAEPDAGLGNGGLGRLAACFLDSCATLQLPVTGYGIRYEYGMFRQRIEHARQVEEPDHWLRGGNPWEIERPADTRRVRFRGHTEFRPDGTGRMRAAWLGTEDVLAVPCDVPVPGYHNETVNGLRLWRAMATDEFNLGEFNAGSYTESVAAKNAAENITMVLYPNDASENGKDLRLRQQYFLASASLQDVVARWVAAARPRLQRPFADKNRFPAQRHASELRRARADAHPHGRARPRLGLGWEIVSPHDGLHQSHAAARGPREVVGAPLRSAPAAAARDHLRDQRRAS